MYGNAMSKIVDRLENEFKVDLSGHTALEFCAREGDWQTAAYASHVKQVCAWEIDPQFLPKLKDNLPVGSEIVIGDSFETATLPDNQHRFDYIVLDNPMCIYGNKCEHFEAMELLPYLSKKEAVIIFNVNIHPYDYEKSPEWAVRRQVYYGRDASKLTLNFCLDFYREKLNDLGFEVKELISENRAPADYLFSIAAILNKQY